MTDEQLIKASRSGDKNAESELLAKYSPLVKSIAARFFLVGGTADDLYQEGMIGLCSAINTFSSGCANFSTYAYTCVRNAVLDAIKKSLNGKNMPLNSSVPIVEIGGALFSSDPEDELIKREQRTEFLQKINKLLSAFEFKVTVMYLDGLTVAEIAASMDKSVKSIGNALTRAKNKLSKTYFMED